MSRRWKHRPEGSNWGEFGPNDAAQGYGWVGSTPQAFTEELSRTIEIDRRIVAATPAGELTP